MPTEAPDGILEIAEELYALALGEFTPARDARAKELKGTDLAAPVRRLRKPSTAAWVVNLLVRREGEQVEQVLALGSALREAQATMSADDLRALTRQRRQLTAAVTTTARAVAREEGVRVTEAVAEQVEATLTAAMVDADCAAAVRSGLLVAPLAATGVDEVDLTESVALPAALGFTAKPRAAEPAARPELRVVPDPDADAKALAAAQEQLAGAEAEVAAAEESLAIAASAVDDLRARELQVEAELDEVRRRLAELETSAEEVEEDLAEAEEARVEAEEAAGSAREARDAAAGVVERLRGSRRGGRS